MVEVTDSGPLGGAPFAPDLNRRLGPETGYGERYPWAHSWSYLRRACRNDHPGHRARLVFGGSLCWQAVSWCVVSEYEPSTIADLWRIPVKDAERHLLNAFDWIIEDMDRKQRFRNARNPAESEEPTPTRITLLQCDAALHSVADFTLQQRIWEGQVGLMREKLGDIEEVSELVREPRPHYVTLTRVQWEQRWSWDREWERRLDALRVHQRTCDRCRRAA